MYDEGFEYLAHVCAGGVCFEPGLFFSVSYTSPPSAMFVYSPAHPSPPLVVNNDWKIKITRDTYKGYGAANIRISTRYLSSSTAYLHTVP